jgi:1,4-dihydroxy-2-naphthoate octaprenyltransferase
MNSKHSQPMPRWKIWWLASRPKTLSAAIAPVLVGTAVALRQGGFQPFAAGAALLVGIFVQVGTNLYNDYADYQRGADTTERLGPLRVTQAGLAAPEAVRRAAILIFGLAGLIGLYLYLIAGWPVLVMGAAAILAGFAYTAGPWPLAYNGLGDVFAWIFFGFMAVCGTAYVQLKEVPFLAWMGGLTLGALITALLAVNNIRDIETDRVAGRRTLPVLLGRRGGLIEVGLCFVVAYLVPPLLLLFYDQSVWFLLPLLTLPSAIGLLRFIAANQGRALNQALAGAARLVLWYGLLLSLTYVLV